MSKFNNRRTSATTNLAGGKALKRRSEEELAFAVLSTFLEDKYYESGSNRQSRIISLIKQVNPKFVANLAVVARKEYYLRSVSHLLIAELSKIDNTHVREATINAVLRPDDVTEVIAYLDGKLSNQLKRGLRRSLFKFDRYQLAKYQGKKNKVSLVDAFNLLHPNPKFANDEQKKAWEDLINGDLKQFNTWENDIEKIPELVRKKKLGYMALLRNLNNVIKYNWDIVEEVCNQLTDIEAVKKSKVLPFRFYTAYKNVTGNIRLTDAITEALELSVENVPKFDGKTLVAIDCSGSMQGRPLEISSILGASFLKNNNCDVILYDNKVKVLKYSTRSIIMDIVNSILNTPMGGGTNTSLVFDYAIKQRISYDRIFILSDNESWQEGWHGWGTQDTYKSYRKATSCNPYVYAIDIEGYGTKDIYSENVFHFTGWSERIFDFIKLAENRQSLVKYIKEYEKK